MPKHRASLDFLIGPETVSSQYDLDGEMVTRIDIERPRSAWLPLNMGADFIARSGLGDELNYVPVDKHTLLSLAFDNIFAVGDATDLPTSKAGSVNVKKP